MNNTLSKFLLLQLFADGAGGSATGTENTGAIEADAASQAGDKKLPITFLDEKQTESDPDAGDQKHEVANDVKSLDEEFTALIKKGGKYADVYKKHFQEQLNARMKANEKQEENAARTRSVMQKLAQLYKVPADDIDAIEKALDNDDKLYADAAVEAGMSVETYREVSRVKAENELYRKAESERVQRSEADKTFRQWLKEADALKESYPEFDLEAEMQNPTFTTLLRNGFTVKNSYESAHIDEILPQAVQNAARQAQIAMSKNIAANNSRPEENASSRSAATTVKRDVASLTDEELDEIDRLSRHRLITLG